MTFSIQRASQEASGLDALPLDLWLGRMHFLWTSGLEMQSLWTSSLVSQAQLIILDLSLWLEEMQKSFLLLAWRAGFKRGSSVELLV